jgi:NAD(P)H-nitrite reductase large subunit
LDNGYEIKADLVVVGAGIELNTEIAKDAGLKMD